MDNRIANKISGWCYIVAIPLLAYSIHAVYINTSMWNWVTVGTIVVLGSAHFALWATVPTSRFAR